MESDGIEHFVDYNSGDCSNHSCNDDLQEELAREFDASHNDEAGCNDDVQEKSAKELNASHDEEAIELKNMVELSANDIMNMEFNNHQKAYEFYVKYGRCVGFGVRKAIIGRDDDGNIIRRRFVCNREGLRDKKHYMRVDRKREHKPETRTNCNAMFGVYIDNNSSTWKVSKFEERHNHDLTPLRFVHEYEIQSSRIMGFMASQTGDYARVGFLKKDPYRYIDRPHAKITDGDGLAAISYLQGKADSDPMMVVRYTTIGNDRLGNLFWADGLSRVDYEYFGDVVAIDLAYKKNQYNKPLVIFSGSNHHRQTCIFACAMLVEVQADTYKWALENLLDAMQKKQPSVVVIDGDEVMSEAIKVVFPNVTHRLCAWHLHKDATSNIKDAEFCEALKKCIHANFDPDEFEEYWHNMIQKFEVYDNEWVKKTYKSKEMWAAAYLRDKFYSGVRTTSRYEGINSSTKRYIKSGHSILELVQHFELAVREYRNNELVAKFNSMYDEPTLTTALESIERGIAIAYTREIFEEVKKELEGAAALSVVGCESIATTAMYKLTKFGKPGCEYKVTYDKNSEKFDCQCYLWNTHGIPCSHIFRVMIHEHIKELPEKMILKRWTKVAKSYHEAQDEEEDSDKTFLLRYGALCAASMWMSFLAAKKLLDFNETSDEICRITTKLEHKFGMVDTGSSFAPRDEVGDSVTTKTKGAPTACNNGNKKRRCSNCNMTGHTKKKCSRVKGGKSRPCEDDLSSSSMSDDPQDAAPDTNNEVEQNPKGSLPSKMPSGKHATTTSGIGMRGPQFYPPNQSQPFFSGPHFNQFYSPHFYPPQFYPAQPHFMGPRGPLPPLVPRGVAQHQYVEGSSHQHPGLAQYGIGSGHQQYPQNMVGNPSIRNDKKQA